MNGRFKKLLTKLGSVQRFIYKIHIFSCTVMLVKNLTLTFVVDLLLVIFIYSVILNGAYHQVVKSPAPHLQHTC